MSLFSTPLQPQQQQQSIFQFQPQSQQQQQQQINPNFQQLPQQKQEFFLFTKEKTPISSYGTKWEDLHPDSQKYLLQIEERILEYRDESQRLDQCSGLFDSSVSNVTFEVDAGRIVQELGGINTTMERQRAILFEQMAAVKDMLHNTEVAVHSFLMLSASFLRPKAGNSTAIAPSPTPGATTASNASTQLAVNAVVPIFDFYSGIPRKPSPFFAHTVTRFEKHLMECLQWIEELEQLLIFDSERNSARPNLSLLQSLPKVISNVHDFFVHVAAKVEGIDQYIESMKVAYLADQRQRGGGNDPFLEADRRETARQEAAAKRVHPTLHLPALPQQSVLLGAPASSTAPAISISSQTSGSLLPPASSSGPSLFGAPSPTPLAATSSLFSTPASPAHAPSLFPFCSPSIQTTLFGFSPASGFGSTPSLFSSSASAFGASDSGGSSLFSMPLASGAAAGSGSSFGTTSKSRAKSRTTRR